MALMTMPAKGLILRFYFVKTYVGTEVRQPLFLQNEWNVCNSAIKVIDFNWIEILFSPKYKGNEESIFCP